LIVILLLTAGPALGQPNLARCLPRAEMYAQLTDTYGETMAGIGLFGPSKNASVAVMLWTNPETGTWTLLTTGPAGLACYMASGVDWQTRKQPLGAPL